MAEVTCQSIQEIGLCYSLFLSYKFQNEIIITHIAEESMALNLRNPCANAINFYYFNSADGHVALLIK
jgi:hypothetical protein